MMDDQGFSVETYDLPSYSCGVNDQGEALYELDGIEMTKAQAEDFKDYFFDDEDDHSFSQDNDTESLPSEIISGLDAVNNALGGSGVAEFYADELLGLGESRMASLVSSSGMSREEIQSHATAVMIDMAAQVGIPSDYLMNELQNDINRVRSLNSQSGLKLLREAIADGIAGDYRSAMTKWDRLRGVLKAHK
ncbi:hypothetical protein [Aeromonas allosaccharophila]|uniref:hypothetical protein n=1 Tax=Aeromonas allosaccharophila TaxID=656 RepID=UPI001FD5AD30|nr:hypothetical protein [Aeromonas allosaccharophila]